MTPLHAFVSRIAAQLRRVRGTQGSLTVPIGAYYYQIASFDEGQLLIEIVGNEVLPDEDRLDAAAEDRLSGLGLLPPGEDSPNWAIALEDATDAQTDAVALAVATALVEVYCVAPPRLEAPLRHLQMGPDSFHLDVRLLEDGSVELAAQDLGPITAPVSSAGEYEYWRTIDVENVPDLVAWIGGEPGDDVIELLARWSGPASFDLERLLRDAAFPVRVFTR